MSTTSHTKHPHEPTTTGEAAAEAGKALGEGAAATHKEHAGHTHTPKAEKHDCKGATSAESGGCGKGTCSGKD